MSKIGFGRKVLKRNIRYVLGDKCAKCGYNTCEAALEVHHLIPELKKHTFGDLIGNISWQEVDQEIQTCVLLCANCHREIHSSLFEIGSSYDLHKSKEMFLLESNIGFFICDKCGKKVSFGNDTCPDCAHKERRVVNRPNRNELKFAIRNMPFTQIGKKYGVSDNAVRKWCKYENLPTSKTEINKISNKDWEKI